MKLRLLSLISIACLTLMGCQSTNKMDTRLALSGSWTLTAADGLSEIPNGILLQLHAKDEAKAESTDTQMSISGFSGVNRFMGTANVDWQAMKLTPGQLASTRKMGPEPRMKFEQSFLQEMQNVNHFQLKDDQLILSTSKNQQLTFLRGAR